VNPFSQADLSFDYSRIDPKYHADAADQEIVLYKGAPRGYENKGFLSMALNRGLTGQVKELKDFIENEDDEIIRALFDEHTSYFYYTALLSATFNPEKAQEFAPTHPLERDRNSTIYQLRIRANRCVVDCYDTGNCGPSKELLILGAIFPEEISAVKIINDDSHSELISASGHALFEKEIDSKNRDVKDPSNWRRLSK
jgi:hypothetical protein